MAATKALLMPLLVLVALTCSCRSVLDTGDEKPVIFGIPALGAFENREFEQIATYPEIQRLASSRSAVVVWREIFSGWVRVKALSIPAGKTLSESLGVRDGSTFRSKYGVLRGKNVIAFNGISRVVILHEKQWRTIDGSIAVGSEEEAEHNPILHPGTIVFVEEARPETPSWFKEK
jgi:hypothetical protein